MELRRWPLTAVILVNGFRVALLTTFYWVQGKPTGVDYAFFVLSALTVAVHARTSLSNRSRQTSCPTTWPALSDAPAYLKDPKAYGLVDDLDVDVELGRGAERKGHEERVSEKNGGPAEDVRTTGRGKDKEISRGPAFDINLEGRNGEGRSEGDEENAIVLDLSESEDDATRSITHSLNQPVSPSLRALPESPSLPHIPSSPSSTSSARVIKVSPASEPSPPLEPSPPMEAFELESPSITDLSPRRMGMAREIAIRLSERSNVPEKIDSEKYTGERDLEVGGVSSQQDPLPRLQDSPPRLLLKRPSRWRARIAFSLRRSILKLLFLIRRRLRKWGKDLRIFCRVLLIPVIGFPSLVSQDFGYERRQALRDKWTTTTSSNMKGHFSKAKPFSYGVCTLRQYGEDMKYCRACRQWQLLRTKHCRDCDACVQMHDHHCPWLGNCVGAENRLLFLYFLFIQSLELTAILTLILTSIVRHSDAWDLGPTRRLPNMDPEPQPGPDSHPPAVSAGFLVPRVFLLTSCFALLSLVIMTVSLFVYQWLLLTMNLTSWELLAWHKVTYLRNCRPEDGSPFGHSSAARNLLTACTPSQVSCLKSVHPSKHTSDTSDTSHASHTVPRYSRAENCHTALSSLQRGPGGEILWRPRRPSQPPTPVKLYANNCCNIYTLCA